MFCIFLSVAALGACIMYVIKAHNVAFYTALGLNIANLLVVIVCFVLCSRASRKSAGSTAEEKPKESEDSNP